jgi:hypothetical protein
MDADKVEGLVVVAGVDDDTSVAAEPHGQAVVGLDDSSRFGIL